ncbi:MAG: hypothetical protein NW220_03390 [Leptolyngbyaceae cyanobacterium bins.349]|nr:hypothetical protein [Leptolyngbyaceae cyanobacterium bins.349]
MRRSHRLTPTLYTTRTDDLMELENKLKEVNTRALEQAIAKVVTEATGWDYACTIRNIQYVNTGTAEFSLTLETTDWLMPKND